MQPGCNTIAAGSRFPLILCWRWRILFEFRNRWIHLVPRLRIRNKNVHLRFEPTGVIQAARQHTDKGRISFFKLSTGDAGSTFGTKTAFMFFALDTSCLVVAQLSLLYSKFITRN